MSTSTIASMFARAVIGAACVISSVSCGSEMLRTGRAPVFLVVQSMAAASGNDTANFVSFLLSDVETIVEKTIDGKTVRVPTIFNDNARATLRVELKNPTITATGLNSVTITRYRVVFRRTDGRNTPGVDVPYGFDGGVGVNIVPGGTGEVAFELVRHQAKLEPPLRNLVGLGGAGFISAIAEITFFGHDQNGNEVTATGLIDVQFGDFADKT